MARQEQKNSEFFWKLNLNRFARIWFYEKPVKKNGSARAEKITEMSELKQMNVLAYILQNVHPQDNTFLLTYDRIAKKTGVSKDTVVRIMGRLGEKDFIRKLQNGVYIVNPYVMMWGPESKRAMLWIQYKDANKLRKTSKKEPESTEEAQTELENQVGFVE